MNQHRHRPAPFLRGSAGFTLIEILVVVIIITILASIVTVQVVQKPAKARVAAAKIQIKQLKLAVQLYRAEHGFYPTQAQGLQALVAKPNTQPIPSNFPSQGYLDSLEVPHDPWSHEYIYLVPGQQGEPFEILSYGSDGERGGGGDAADLSSSQP